MELEFAIKIVNYKNSPYLTLDENVTDSTEFEAQPVNKNLIINYLINKW